MENKFTKGEWHLSHSPTAKSVAGRIYKSIKNQKTIGGSILANAYGTTIEEAEANAKLIAAAPDLLEALNNLIFTASKLWDEVKNIKDSDSMTVTHPIIEEAKAAINKATA